jgi:hypothetical protein
MITDDMTYLTKYGNFLLLIFRGNKTKVAAHQKIIASHAKVHPHACGAVDGNQDMTRTKGG